MVLPDAPFGTYTQPTVLRLLPLGPLLVLIGGVLAFRRPGVAGLLFVAVGVWGCLNVLKVFGIQDPTSPPGTSNTILVWAALPPLGVGALLLATWWAEHRAPRRSRRAPDTTPHPSAATP